MLETLSQVPWWAWIPIGYGVVSLAVAATPTKKDDEALQRVEDAVKGLVPKVLELLELASMFKRGSLKPPGKKS